MSVPSFDSLKGSCLCGKTKYAVAGVHSSTPAADCHCPKCRKYHVAAFSSYIITYKDFVQWEGEPAAIFQDTCDEKGTVERLYCRECHSKLATRLNDGFETVLLSMGSVLDSSISTECSQAWQTQRRTWQPESAAVWKDAKPPPLIDPSTLPPRLVTGSCSCGESSYRIQYGPYSELQHCYCKLCRTLSGSAYMTWVPAGALTWTSNKEPPLVRATGHGQRHVCPKCSSVLTIVYDSDPDFVWPAAGAFDDESLPDNMEAYLHRCVHICCAWKQDWYRLPDDGLERIDYAS